MSLYITGSLLKASFQINGFGRDKSVCGKEMHQLRIVRVDQGVYFSDAECHQVIDKLLNQLLPDTLMLAIGINGDGLKGCLFRNTIFSYKELPHYKPHHPSIFFLCYMLQVTWVNDL